MPKSSYWTFNLPLQLWPQYAKDDDTDSGPVLNYRILNYMPRKECCTTLNLNDVLNGSSREEFFEQAALTLENLAGLFRRAKNDPKIHIYYPDEGMEAE